MERRFNPGDLKQVVIKVGSASIINENHMVRLGFIGKLVTTIGKLRSRKVNVVLVSSGAIAMGANLLKFESRPVKIADKQVCASTGQTELMALYQRLFLTLGIQTGQVLLTRDDLEDRRRYLNARENLLRMMELDIVPIVNENDSVSVDEIKFGDNDELSALVAGLIDADLLLLLTNVNGLYDGNPKTDKSARVIETIEHGVQELFGLVAKDQSEMGSGGMKSKLEAATLCRNYGIPCIIAKGAGTVIEQALRGKPVGTYVAPLPQKVHARERWIASAANFQGVLTIDRGAVDALKSRAVSLLPKGIKEVNGDFLRGAVVACQDSQGNEIARGVVRYGAQDLRKIIGRHAGEIETILGFTFGDEVIHRNNLVVRPE